MDEEKELSLDEDEAEELEPELQYLDGEDMEMEVQKESEERSTGEAVKRILKRVGIGVAFIIVAVYIGFAMYFSNHFCFNTIVNGVDQSLMSVERAEAHFEQQVKSYALIIKREDGMTEKISGSAFDMTYEKSNEVSELVKSQNPWDWPMSLFRKQELSAAIGVKYNESKLHEAISKLNCMKADGQTAPLSASLEYNGTKFEIVPEQPGNQIDEERLFARIRTCLLNVVSEVDLSAEDCYAKPKYTSESPEVVSACEQMNKYLTAEITYVIGSEKVVVDKDVIQGWLLTRDTMEVVLSATKIKEYVASLAEQYDTYGTERTFTSGSGATVKVSGGDYGWKIDQDAEYKELVANLKGYQVVEREPKYSKEAVSREGLEWGDTYVEVDLTNQKVYLIKGGKVILDTPCVTGNTSKVWITPPGVYSIKFLKKDAVLRGPKKDGKYEWESPVTFWMPFNGAIGLHDASWQTSFGKKDGYLLTGSRGCVNLKYDAAKMIFENVSAGTPVICYY